MANNEQYDSTHLLWCDQCPITITQDVMMRITVVRFTKCTALTSCNPPTELWRRKPAFVLMVDAQFAPTVGFPNNAVLNLTKRFNSVHLLLSNSKGKLYQSQARDILLFTHSSNVTMPVNRSKHSLAICTAHLKLRQCQAQSKLLTCPSCAHNALFR
jgi:hypothetical protein